MTSPIPDNLGTIRKRLKAELKVAVEWDDRFDPAKWKEALDVARDAGTLVRIEDLEKAISEGMQSGTREVRKQAEQVQNAYKPLSDLIEKRALAVKEKAERSKTPPEKIPEPYFKKVAISISEEAGEKMVIVAPDLWFPSGP